jgi:hypothetical protein
MELKPVSYAMIGVFACTVTMTVVGSAEVLMGL